MAHATAADNFSPCECDNGWTLPDCSLYTGECDDDDCLTCPSAPNQCETCVENGELYFNSGPDEWACRCINGWAGVACSDYEGDCAYQCKVCTGTSDEECLECIENADWTVFGTCECKSYWEGDNCDVYTGSCHPHCEASHGCTGPTPEDCNKCAHNADWLESGGAMTSSWSNRGCVCKDGFGGANCQRYTGKCEGRCSICLGPNIYQCLLCVENAVLDVNGLC